MIDNLNSTINSNHGFNCPSLDLRVNSVAILGTIAATKVVNKSDLAFSGSSLSTDNCSQLLSSQSINESLFSDFNDNLGEESSNESGNFEYVDLTQVDGVCFIFILLYSTVILFSILGNIIVACTVVCNRKMQTVVNYYIVNLALCDFLIGFFVAPIKLIELTVPASWSILNDNLCTALNYLQTVIVFTSVLTLVAICFERYFAVVHPLRSRVHQSKSRTIKILHGVWYIPLIAAGPFLMPSKAYPNRLTSPLGTIERLSCFDNFSPAFRSKYYTCLFIFFYLIPLLFIGWTCFQIARCLIKQTILQREGLLHRQEVNRRKVAKMILVVVFAFTISWTPYFLVSIVTQYQEVNFMSKHNYFFTMLCINLFAFLNSSINPLIYVLMSTRFRLGFTNILHLMLCISSHEELEDSDRIVSGDQHHNHHNNNNNERHGKENHLQQTAHQSHQLRGKNENDESSKAKPLTHMAKYRHRLVMFICGQVIHLSTDSGHSESSPPVSGCLPDKPTEELDENDLGKKSDGIKIESKADCLSINGSKLTSNVPQVNSYLPSITVSTHLQQPNVTPLGSSPNSVASTFIPHLIQSDCTDGSGETQGIYLNDSGFSKRRYSDNLLSSIKFDNPLNESETENNTNKLINNPLNEEPSLASNKLSTQNCLNTDDSHNNNLNNDNQSGQINYNRSKSEPHFITSTQL